MEAFATSLRDFADDYLTPMMQGPFSPGPILAMVVLLGLTVAVYRWFKTRAW